MSGYNGYDFIRLTSRDYNLLMSFYEAGIDKLSDKRFFMNYTADELEDVLSSGYVLGAFYKDRLISVCAFDSDKAFGDKLASICSDKSGLQYYEFSGIMTDDAFRGQGISNALCMEVIEYARENYSPCVLCATVQHDNIPSLSNLGKLGFKIVAQAPYKEYNFKYLTFAV